MNIKFKNAYIPTLIKLLDSLELKNKETRMRTRFKNQLIEYNLKVINKEKKELIDKYAQFKEDGSYKTLDNGDLDISEESAILINESINELLCEDLTINVDNTNKDMFITISKIMLEGDFTISGHYADAYDEWCSEFEQVLEFFNVNE